MLRPGVLRDGNPLACSLIDCATLARHALLPIYPNRAPQQIVPRWPSFGLPLGAGLFIGHET
ncbi:hypothetical protein LMG33810_002112 [Carnimonas sp. LMG 33810]